MLTRSLVEILRGPLCRGSFKILLASSISLLEPIHRVYAQALTETSPPHVVDELLVQFRPQATDQQLADAFGQASLEIREHILTPAMAPDHPGLNRIGTKLSIDRALSI